MKLIEAYSSKATTRNLCHWLSIPPSVHYYKPKMGKPGVLPSSYTLKTDGTTTEIAVVMEDIRKLLSQEFVNYGYEKVTVNLTNMKYIINNKKVYRLMNESNLLLGKKIKTSGKRNFVKHRKIEVTYPIEYICLDIKYVYVHGEGRNYYLLTVLDVFSRKALAHIFKRSNRKIDVINVFRRVNLFYGIKGVTIRNDNGSQFIANDVRRFLFSMQAHQEFTHIAIPEENAYIEAFHSVLQRDVIDRNEFNSYYEARIIIDAYRKFYNEENIHRRIGMIAPNMKWEQVKALEPLRQKDAHVTETLSRSADSDKIKNEETAVSYNLDKDGVIAYLCQSGDKYVAKNDDLVLNLFEKNFQLIGG